MIIKRTPLGFRPRAVQLTDPFRGDGYLYADTVFESEYPDTSPILGPDGHPLRYEPRPKIGFKPGGH